MVAAGDLCYQTDKSLNQEQFLIDQLQCLCKSVLSIAEISSTALSVKLSIHDTNKVELATTTQLLMQLLL